MTTFESGSAYSRDEICLRLGVGSQEYAVVLADGGNLAALLLNENDREYRNLLTAHELTMEGRDDGRGALLESPSIARIILFFRRRGQAAYQYKGPVRYRGNEQWGTAARPFRVFELMEKG